MDIEYVVSKGDTLYGISKQFGVTIDDIVLQNSLMNTNLKIGQVLQIPSREDYTVKKGDTLYSISKKYDVSVSDIILFNQLKTMILQVGQKIKIPSNSATSFEYYTVKKGDTLYSIAKRFGISVSDLIEINQLNIQLQEFKSKYKNNLAPNTNDMLKLPTENDETHYELHSMKQDDKLISVNFVSMENIENINIGHYSLICKKRDLFVELEARLYNKFPEYKKYETYFMVNAKRIKRFLSLEQNNIKNNDIINIFIIDE